MARTVRTLVCASPLCPPYRGRHTQVCLDEVGTKCDGCLPRLAVDGGYLCQLCARLLAEDPVTLAGRYAALERVLAGGGVGADVHVAVCRDPNLQLNEAAARARRDIRDELTGLARLIVVERGVYPPTRSVRSVQVRPDDVDGAPLIGPMPAVETRFYDTSVPALAGLVSKHAGWLAAHPTAGEHAQILRELVRGSFAVAYPNGTRLFPVRIPRPVGATDRPGVASCPESVRVRVAFSVSRRGVATEIFGPQPCPGSLWTVLRPRDDRLPAELLCNAVESHRWPVREWLRLGAVLARQVAVAVAEAGAVEDGRLRPVSVSGVTVRLLAQRTVEDVFADYRRMDAATEHVSTGRGFRVRCRVCTGDVVEAGWGVPVEALLDSWGRHVCPEGRVA